jgi:hypothetical protein
MGVYAAQCMSGKHVEMGGEFAFELFTHVTRFFGYKVRPFPFLFTLILEGEEIAVVVHSAP